MRISDWSSDVCSSDLKRVDAAALAAGWRDFAGRVAAQFPRLDAMGIAYRVAPPGARIADGMLEANSVFPGTAIEYRRGGSGWTRYERLEGGRVGKEGVGTGRAGWSPDH